MVFKIIWGVQILGDKKWIVLWHCVGLLINFWLVLINTTNVWRNDNQVFQLKFPDNTPTHKHANLCLHQ